MESLIGLTGAARSGKDTAAQFLMAERGYVRYALADILKEAAGLIFGLNHDQLHGDQKEIKIDYWQKSPREILQLMGTEGMRDVFGEDIWIKALERKIKTDGYPKVVITDVRFDNEAQWITSLGGTVVKILRSECPEVKAHASEAGVSDHFCDEYVVNDYTIDHLHTIMSVIVPHAEETPLIH